VPSRYLFGAHQNYFQSAVVSGSSSAFFELIKKSKLHLVVLDEIFQINVATNYHSGLELVHCVPVKKYCQAAIIASNYQIIGKNIIYGNNGI